MTPEISPTLPRRGSGLEFDLQQTSARRKLAMTSRLASLVPYVIFSFPWLFAGFAVSVFAWFAILATGRYPSGLFAFNVRAWRFLVTTTAYACLVVDARPSMSGVNSSAYPLQVDVTPLPEYNRLLTGFRAFVLIPLMLVSVPITLAAYLLFIPSLLMVTLLRHQPKSLQRLMASYVRNYARYMSSWFLLTEIWWVTD
jgi:Domain of unknown function (DUF4389)